MTGIRGEARRGRWCERTAGAKPVVYRPAALRVKLRSGVPRQSRAAPELRHSNSFRAVNLGMVASCANKVKFPEVSARRSCVVHRRNLSALIGRSPRGPPISIPREFRSAKRRDLSRHWRQRDEKPSPWGDLVYPTSWKCHTERAVRRFCPGEPTRINLGASRGCKRPAGGFSTRRRKGKRCHKATCGRLSTSPRLGRGGIKSPGWRATICS